MSYRVSYRGGGFNLGPIGYLILINLVLLIISYFSDNLIPVFGLRPISFPSKWWTVITCMFLHAGMWHFFVNMLTLYFFGSYLTRLVGERNFLVTYFIGGLFGSAFFLLLGPPYSVAIGASGAVYAVAGALTVLRPNLKVYIIPIPVPIPLWIAVIGGFLLVFLPSLAQNIAWQAHLGGLIFGLIAGFAFRRRPRWFI